MSKRSGSVLMIAGVLGATLLGASGVARGDYYLERNIGLDAWFGPAGNNPVTMTADGSYAYIGGYTSAADAGTIGILRINMTNPAEANILPGGTLAVGQFRYYGGLVYRAGIVYGLIDRPDGNFTSTQVRAIDVSTGALVPTFWGDFEDGNGIVYEPAILTDQGATGGLALDPGYGGDGTGLSILAYNKGRRGLIRFDNGQTIYAFGAGMIVADTHAGGCTVADMTAWRDHVYTPAGNLFMRRSNQVQKSTRNGPNGILSSGYVHLTDALNADGSLRLDCGDGKPVQMRAAAGVMGQTLEYIPASSAGTDTDLIIFNDRYTNTPTAQPFASVVKMVDTNGLLLVPPVQLRKADGTPLDTGDVPTGITGIYDFFYDSVNDRLLILDFTARNLLIFSPEAPCGTIPQDGDKDGDVDLADYTSFEPCLSGPDVARPGDPYCACADRDYDGDVDLEDFAAFQAVFTQ